MDRITLDRVTRCDTDGTEMEFTVRGHKVQAVFPSDPNVQAYHQIRRILEDTCIENFLSDKSQKIRQNS